MNLIFFSRRQGKSRHLNLSNPLTLAVVGLAGLALLAGVFTLGLRVA